MVRHFVFSEPCPKCKGTLTEDKISDELYEWYKCINCGFRGRCERTHHTGPSKLP